MKQNLGLSLLELLVCVALLSVLTAISLPQYNKLMASIAGEATLRGLASAIQLGKTAAIVNATTVTLCRSSDAFTCGGSWHEGIIVFSDRNRDRKINEDDRLLRQIEFPESNGQLKFRSFQNKQYLQLTEFGTTRYQNGNFTYCPANGSQHSARQLIINRTARLRLALDRNNDGIREDSQGRPITCN